MKKTFKSLICILVVSIILFGIMPLNAFAAVSYAELNYDYILPLNDALSSTDIYVDVDINGDVRSGYAQCYMVFLSYGSEYTIEIDDSCENAEYIERSIIVFYDNLTGDLTNDLVSYGYNFDNAQDLNTWLTFTAPESGVFYILSLALVHDESYELISDSSVTQSIYLTLDDAYDYTDLDYSEELNVGTAVKGYIDESEPLIENLNGYISNHKGYSVQLQGGKKYIINANVQNKVGGDISNYVSVALLNNNLTGDVEADCIVKEYNYASYSNPAGFTFVAEVEETGTYKLIFDKFCNGSDGYYYGSENTETHLSIREADVSDYDIYTKQDLLDFNVATVRDEADVYNVNFFADIDMSGEEWSSVNCFYVNVQGNEHAITGMCEPLFDSVNNLYIYDIDVEMNYSYNNIEEYHGYIAVIAREVYRDLYMFGCNVTGNININAYQVYDVAGLVSDVYGASIYVENCTADVDMQLTAVYNVDYIGGAFAYIDTDGYIGNVEYTGNITINSGEGYYYYIGGVVGELYAPESFYFENCYAKGMIIAMAPQNTDEYSRGYDIGGFAGYIED